VTASNENRIKIATHSLSLSLSLSLQELVEDVTVATSSSVMILPRVGTMEMSKECCAETNTVMGAMTKH